VILLLQFLLKHKFYDEKYLAIDKLNNFLNYINSFDYNLDPSKTLVEIIEEALEYKNVDSSVKKYIQPGNIFYNKFTFIL